MTPAQLDYLLDAEHRLSAPVDGPQRAQEPAMDLVGLAARARKGR